MKNILKFLLLVIVGCGVTSCKDFLYPDTTDSLDDANYYTTDAQVESALTSIYATLRSSNLGSTYLSTFTGFSDEEYHYNSSTDRVMDFSVTSSNSSVKNFWTALYAPLKDVAYLLSGLERNIDNLSEDVYKHAKGEALFFRGYFHFLLAQWFCHPDIGIPMYIDVITSYDDTKMPLSSLDDFYVQIIEDMEAAEVLLEDQTWASLGYSERVTVNAVRGMLARVCLFGAGFPNYGSYKGEKDPEFYYKKALSKALLVTEMGHELEDNYSSVFIAEVEDTYVSENIWEVGYDYSGSGASETSTAGAIGSQTIMGPRRRCWDFTTSEYIYDSCLVWNVYRYFNPLLYQAYGHGDTRRAWNCPNFTYEDQTMKKVPSTERSRTCSTTAMGEEMYNTGILPTGLLWGQAGGKWRREYEDRVSRDQNSTSTNFPLLRYSDVLLMVAEAYIELGQPANAAPYINEVRYRAVPYTSQTKIIGRIVTNNQEYYERGYGRDPVITMTDPGSGEGFEFFSATNLYGSVYSYTHSGYYGHLNIGISNPGSGYTVPPTLEAEASNFETWEANTLYKAGEIVSVLNSSSVPCMYQALEDGTSTSVSPSHTEDLYDETNEALEYEITDPTYTEAYEEQGVAWSYLSTCNASAPEIEVVTIDSDVADVSFHVDVTNQEDMRDFLREERMRELCFEGLRRQDLRRWGLLYDTIKNLVNLRDGGVEGIPATTGATYFDNIVTYMVDYKLYLPIPLTQLSLNPNLIQAPGY